MMPDTSLEGASPAAKILAGLLETRTGQVISPNRYWRIESALKPVLIKYNIPDLDALVAVLLGVDNEAISRAVTEAMLNNESSFFRDATVFSLFEQRVLPRLYDLRANESKLRIWCAGCSSGQEAYSLAMMIADERMRWRDWQVDILATDISQQMIDRAKQGMYSQFEIQRGLSVATMLRYFRQHNDQWQISDDIRKMVTFRQDSLLRPNSHDGQFDLILCRNVLMYFSPESRHRAFNRLAQSLKPDGFLTLGAAETVIGHDTAFVASRDYRGLYVKDVQTDMSFRRSA